jgi:hypothetical protein
VCQLGLYKISCIPKGKDATIEDLKLEILLSFYSPVAEHYFFAMDFSICFPKTTHTHTHTQNEEDRGLQLERGSEIFHR